MRGNSALMGSFAIDLVAMTFGMPRALFAVLALDGLRRRARAAPACSTPRVSAGAVVAALTTGWVEHARWLGRIVIGAVLVWGLAIAGAGFMPSLWPAAALLAVAGAADSISAVCRSIINQSVTPEALRGRMSAIFMLVVTSGPRLGDLESGIAASLTTAGVAVVSGGLACVAGVVPDRRAVPGAGGLRRPSGRRSVAQLLAIATWATHQATESVIAMMPQISAALAWPSPTIPRRRMSLRAVAASTVPTMPRIRPISGMIVEQDPEDRDDQRGRGPAMTGLARRGGPVGYRGGVAVERRRGGVTRGGIGLCSHGYVLLLVDGSGELRRPLAGERQQYEQRQGHAAEHQQRHLPAPPQLEPGDERVVHRV